MIYGKIILEDDYTLKGGSTPTPPKENNYTLNTGDNDVEPEDNAEEPDVGDDNPDDTSDSDYTLGDDEIDPDNTLSNEEDPTEDNPDDTGDDGDYTLGDDETNLDDGTDTEDPINDNVDNDVSGDVENELVQKEKELFGKLTDQEMEIKNKELKSNFEKIYIIIDDIQKKILRIPTDVTIQNVIDYISGKLDETQDDIVHYIYNTYDNKSYFQNLKQYNFYILILKNIEELFKQISNKNNQITKGSK